MKSACIAFALIALTSVPSVAQTPVQRLFSCVKPDNDWADGMSKKDCLSLRDWKGRRGRWLPKDEDSIVRPRRSSVCMFKPYNGMPENYILGGTEQDCARIGGRWLQKGDSI